MKLVMNTVSWRWRRGSVKPKQMAPLGLVREDKVGYICRTVVGELNHDSLR